MELFDNIEYENKDFTKEAMELGDYEECSFVNCNFSQVDLATFMFINCTFIGSNLSLAKLINTIFREVIFKECKMTGLFFDTVNPFGFSCSFDHCNLSSSSFFKVKMKNAQFSNSTLVDVDFTECDINGSVLRNCDLTNAVFDQSNLEKVDFRTSYNYVIDIDRNRIKKSQHSLQSIHGLLYKYDILID